MSPKIDTSSISNKDNIKAFTSSKNATNNQENPWQAIADEYFPQSKIKYKFDGNTSSNSQSLDNTHSTYSPFLFSGDENSLIQSIPGNNVINDIKEFLKKQMEEEENKRINDLLSGSLETLGDWYIKNIPTYGTQTYSNPFVSYPARADCTGFAAVYMSVVAGVELSTSSSYFMVDPNDEWAAKAKAAGWVAYTSDEIGSLKTGDVLVANAGRFYSDSGNHAEVYIDEEHTFGWGHVWNSYPRNNPVKTTKESDGHIHFRDYKANGQCSHDYITVYRYEPDKKMVEDKK